MKKLDALSLLHPVYCGSTEKCQHRTQDVQDRNVSGQGLCEGEMKQVKQNEKWKEEDELYFSYWKAAGQSNQRFWSHDYNNNDM